jgi:hypothetical protein
MYIVFCRSKDVQRGGFTHRFSLGCTKTIQLTFVRTLVIVDLINRRAEILTWIHCDVRT